MGRISGLGGNPLVARPLCPIWIWLAVPPPSGLALLTGDAILVGPIIVGVVLPMISMWTSNLVLRLMIRLVLQT